MPFALERGRLESARRYITELTAQRDGIDRQIEEAQNEFHRALRTFLGVRNTDLLVNQTEKILAIADEKGVDPRSLYIATNHEIDLALNSPANRPLILEPTSSEEYFRNAQYWLRLRRGHGIHNQIVNFTQKAFKRAGEKAEQESAIFPIDPPVTLSTVYATLAELTPEIFEIQNQYFWDHY